MQRNACREILQGFGKIWGSATGLVAIYVKLAALAGVEYGYWVNRSDIRGNNNIVKRLRMVSTSKSAISNIHYYYIIIIIILL